LFLDWEYSNDGQNISTSYLDVGQGGQPLGAPDGVLTTRKRAGLATDLVPVGGTREEDNATGGSLKYRNKIL